MLQAGSISAGEQRPAAQRACRRYMPVMVHAHHSSAHWPPVGRPDVHLLRTWASAQAQSDWSSVFSDADATQTAFWAKEAQACGPVHLLMATRCALSGHASQLRHAEL
jgi:hypothetical protein